ncbi:M20/M25/M40 family metallo-hydrolase [Phaeobacter sp. B1627]|uniref:M20/M25/M40 family metallo-hydrolase n=1 Tax=Phaeobacter sp. B1627 TaxID=2583809 RepID=UPI001118D66F|nr:M20/M25/M40 family metallo-hydrolase [Phaeobacter sp. B1627]TNJ40604.1 M20/M25/M40 family metallo-hydrolase [Phaeobacter sp. B1627]
MVDDILDYAEANMQASLERLFELIRIPSVSTDPAYRADCRRTAEWLAADLKNMGADASARETIGHPMVLGHFNAPQDKPKVLFYGHYDVQPADPLALWDGDPFEPVLVTGPDGKPDIRARGASDDKGAMMTFVEACRAWISVRGALPVGVSVLFEGEEESGSQSLGPFLAETAEELACDAVLVCDSDQWDADTPAITTMIRGICGQELTVRTANRDLHSGIYGMAARNALTLMCDLMASLRAPDGSVAIDGFYDGVEEPDPLVAEAWSRQHFDGDTFLNDIGLSLPAGETSRTIQEQVWTRPSLDLHGVWGGYTDPGFKTVIPCEAHAKLSFRLVAGQDPARIAELFQSHINARLPQDCSVEFHDRTMGQPIALPVSSPYLQAALAGLKDEWGTAAISGMGGSIPIIPQLKAATGADALLVGFAALDNRIHAPNEKFDLESFERGIRSWIHILHRLSEL